MPRFAAAFSAVWGPVFVPRSSSGLRCHGGLGSGGAFVRRLDATLCPTDLICCQAPFHLHFTHHPPSSHPLCGDLFTPAVQWRRGRQCTNGESLVGEVIRCAAGAGCGACGNWGRVVRGFESRQPQQAARGPPGPSSAEAEIGGRGLLLVWGERGGREEGEEEGQGRG